MFSETTNLASAKHWFTICLHLGIGSALPAQPAIDPPAPLNNLGTAAVGDVRGVGQIFNLQPPGVAWFRFVLTEPIDRKTNTWLELDTSGPTNFPNTTMALYDAWGNLLASDDDSGGSAGSGNNGTAAGLSLGSGSGRLLSGVGGGFGGGRISFGDLGPTSLAPGTYYVGVSSGGASFNDRNPDWEVNIGSGATEGTVRLRLETGQLTGAWREEIEAGSDLVTAETVRGSGPLNQILMRFNVDARDIFRIDVCSPEDFGLQVVATREDGLSDPARVFVLDTSGRGVVAVARLDRADTLTLPPGTPAGEYFVVMQNSCDSSSGPSAVPYDVSGQPLWAFNNPLNQSAIPDGPGGQNPVATWGRPPTSCENRSQQYWITANLTGACFIDQCPDFDDDGEIGLSDLAIVLSQFGAACP